jgi:hypothetical protein
MADYFTRVGAVVRPAPATDYAALVDQPTRAVADDGTVIVHVGDPTSVTCVDCGVGRLRWAEAGHVPGHRICDRCGSHWDLRVVRIRLGHDPTERVPCPDGPAPTWGDFYERFYERVSELGPLTGAPLTGAWARRARYI